MTMLDLLTNARNVAASFNNVNKRLFY